MTMLPDNQGWYSLAANVPLHEIDALGQLGLVGRLSVNKTPLLTVRLAKRLESVHIDHLWLWCRATACAMRHVIRIPSLRVLDVFHIQDSGRLPSFRHAPHLEVLRANHGLSHDDLCRIAHSPVLRELGAQGADITRDALSAILAMPARDHDLAFSKNGRTSFPQRRFRGSGKPPTTSPAIVRTS